MFGIASDDKEGAATRTSRYGGGNGSTTTCFVVRESVPHLDVAAYNRQYANTLNASRFAAMFSDGQISTMFDLKVIRRETDICAWNQKWASAGEWRADTMDPASCFDMPFIRHGDEVTFVRVLRWMLSGTEND